jgi:hypothetical protein
MAIRLASAIGQQRTPVDMYGGIGDAINKTGDAIQAQQIEKAKAAAKKAEQDQQYKDLVAATLKPRSLEGVRREDWEEDQAFQKEGLADILLSSKDQNVTKAQIEQKQKDFIEGLQKREFVYKRDNKVLENTSNAYYDGDLTEDMDNLFAGKDFPNALNQEGTPLNTDWKPSDEAKPLNTPYFKKSLDERLKTDLESEYNKRVVKPLVGALDASKDVFSKEFDGQAYVEKTVNQNGGWDYSVNNKAIESDANRYGASFVGNTNLGVKHKREKDAMEKIAVLQLRNNGFTDEQIAQELPNIMFNTAKQNYIEMAQRDVDSRLKNQKEDPLRKEGKNSEFNINIGAGGENKLWKFGVPAETKIREGGVRNKDTKELIKGKEGDLVDYDYVSMQTKVPADNPPITVGANSGMHFQGVYKNKKNGDISYFKFTKAADGSGEEILVPLSELKSSTFTDIKTNIGEDDFDKATATGKYKPKKEEKKAEPKKENLDKAAELINKYRKK